MEYFSAAKAGMVNSIAMVSDSRTAASFFCFSHGSFFSFLLMGILKKQTQLHIVKLLSERAPLSGVFA